MKSYGKGCASPFFTLYHYITVVPVDNVSNYGKANAYTSLAILCCKEGVKDIMKVILFYPHPIIREVYFNHVIMESTFNKRGADLQPSIL